MEVFSLLMGPYGSGGGRSAAAELLALATKARNHEEDLIKGIFFVTSSLRGDLVPSWRFYCENERRTRERVLRPLVVTRL